MTLEKPASPTHLTRLLSQQLMRHPPFSAMAATDVAELLLAASEVYHAPGETVLSPASGTVTHVYLIRQGEVAARRGVADSAAGVQHHEEGDMFPIGAALARRAVTSTYEAASDLFCLRIPVDQLEALARRSPALADFLARKTMQLLELSRRALQASQASQALQELSLERPLRDMLRGQPVTCSPSTPLREVLQTMHGQRIGSMLVVDDEQRLLGIFTRQDVLDKVALAETPLDTPVAAVMTRQVQTLEVDGRAENAALLMSRHGFTHVPLIENGRVVGLVSERDLFAIQRLSLKQVGTALRHASSVAELAASAQAIRELARSLVGQGMQAKSLTALISHLNDLLTNRLVDIVAAEQGLSTQDMCWLSFGSEGRSEQTIATDQDNGLVFVSDRPEQDRARWLAFGDAVCRALDACGYPLCKGNIMASNPECCLALSEWTQRFDRWIEQGTPEDLLKASIYFDLRPLAGQLELGLALRQHVAQRARPVPRFHKMLASDLLRRQVPLNWRGGIETHDVAGRKVVDLKLQGTAIFVDVARVLALSLGITETHTRSRLEAAAAQRGTDPREAQAWCSAFEYLQMLRLQAQLAGGAQAALSAEQANLVEPGLLNDIDRRLLKSSLNVARTLQQGLRLDFGL